MQGKDENINLNILPKLCYDIIFREHEHILGETEIPKSQAFLSSKQICFILNSSKRITLIFYKNHYN